MPRQSSRTPCQARPSQGLVPNRPLPEMLWEPKVVQHTPKDKPDPRRATFDIPLNEDLFWLHLGPPRSWTPYMFDVAGTFPAHEATRERFRLDFDKIRH